MSAEQRLGMSLDDIIKTNKKGRTPAKKTPAKGAKKTVNGRGAVKASPGRVTKKVGAATKRVQQMRQNKAKKALVGRGKNATVASTSKLVSQLVKKALMQTSRLQQARQARTPKRLQAAAMIRPTFTLKSNRKPIVSGQLRSRLGWTGKARGGRANARGRGAVTKGRGLAGQTHMDVEQGQRRNRVQQHKRVASQLNQQRMLKAQQLQQTRIQKQLRQQQVQRQLLQQQRQRMPIRGRGGRGMVNNSMGGGQASSAQFIRNTVFKAMAEAAMGRVGPVQQHRTAPARRRGGGFGGGLQSRGAMVRQQRQPQRIQQQDRQGGMRAFPDNQSFIQSRPRRQRQASSFFGGDSFDAPQPMRAVFSSGSAARTLDERFGGRRQQFF